jgi:hypothetical protein
VSICIRRKEVFRIIKTRIKSHVLEKVIMALMAIFGIAAIAIFYNSFRMEYLGNQIAMIELLLIIVLAILAQTVVLIRIYEQHD